MDKLWAEWFTLYDWLQKTDVMHKSGCTLSAPFFSDDSTNSNAEHKLLYVGQAIRETWHAEEFHKQMELNAQFKVRAEERKQKNRHAVEGGYLGGAFQLTFRAMSEALRETLHKFCDLGLIV